MTVLTRKKTLAAAGVFALLGGLAIPAAAHAVDPPAVADDPITLDAGHIDAFNPVLNADDSIRLALKEDVTGSHVLRTPESVELFVKPAAQMTVPEGYLPGMPSDVYHLPLTQDANLIWPGWDTQAISSAFPGANTEIAVSEVDGPGKMFLWTQGQFGAPASLLTDGGFELPGTISQPYPAHTHAAWAFTEPGTYKLAVQATATASTGVTGSSQVATYTFVVAERTKLTPEAPSREGNTVTIPEQRWITYTDADGAPIAPGQLALDGDLSVVAHPASGFELADGASASWDFTLEDGGASPVLTITGLRGHYHQNTPIVLTAVAEPAVEGASYQWLMQRSDQSEPVLLAGQTGAEARVTAEQALNGAAITARVLDSEGKVAATADPVSIEVDDHGAAALQRATIAGVADHYHSEGTANLTASVSPASVLTRWVWEVRAAGESAWTAVEGADTESYSFAVTSALNGAEVRARLAYDDGREAYAPSEPVTITIDDHHGPEPVETELSLTGLADAYRAGDVAKLTAVQTPQTDEDHYHWFIKRAGAEAYAVIPGAMTADLAYTVTDEDADATVIARLYDHDHDVIAESAPATLRVTRDEPATAKPGTAPTPPAGTALDGVPAGGIVLDRSSVAQGGTVTAQIGEGTVYAGKWVAAWMFSEPVLLGGDWQQVSADGTITVRVAADAPVGEHRIAAFDADGALIGWQAIEVTATGDSEPGAPAPGGGKTPAESGASGQLSATGADLAVLAGVATLLLAAGAGAAFIARRRSMSTEG